MTPSGKTKHVITSRSMRIRYVCAAVIFTVTGLAPLSGLLATQNTSSDECSRTANMSTYSSAQYVEEAGDVVGYELVIEQNDGHSVTSLLYVYQGVPNED